jgi:D-xylose transport system permease protein
MSTMLDDPRIADAQSLGHLGKLRSRLSRAELGPLPILLGLGVIWAIFQIANPNFLTPLNLTNLMLQIAATGTIAIGVVLVLLLGEIDLSLGAVSGLSAAIMAVLNVKLGVPAPLAVLAGLAAGALIGLLQGWWFARLRVPAFIVTLAGQIGWTGALLYVLGNTGTINLRDPVILSLAGTFFPTTVGWIVGVLFVLIFAVSLLRERQRRRAAGLSAATQQALAARVILMAVGVLGATAVLNANRGLPSAVVIFLGLVVLFDYITRRTPWGRHVYAVGGNAEAARRASISVAATRIAIFTLASTLAATGGILAASRLLAVNQSSGSGELLLNTIASAVIGGTSLFGGRGSVWAALLGALVIGSISNGMDLLALASPIKFMITGAVLLTAVTIDALTRQRREAAGR